MKITYLLITFFTYEMVVRSTLNLCTEMKTTSPKINDVERSNNVKTPFY